MILCLGCAPIVLPLCCQVIGSFFVMNLFVGVVIENFNNMKAKLGVVSSLMTDTQREWVRTMRLMNTMTLKPRLKSNNLIRRFCFTVSMHMYFEMFTMLCITLNTIVMAMPYYVASDEYL